MNESIDQNEFERLINQPRLLRSLYNQRKILCQLNDNNRLEIVGAPDRHETTVVEDFDEENKNFESIIDDKERAEAYRDLARQLDEIIKQEKADNIKNLTENSEFIKDQQKQIEKLESELKLLHEQNINSKELINQLSDQNTEYKESIQLLEQQATQLNEKITNAQALWEDINIEDLIQKILNLYPEENREGEENQDLNDTINNIAADLNTLKPTIKQAQNLLNSKMNVEAKDVIAGIPMFSGDVKLLDGFLNACELYYNLVEANQKETVLKIIKAKVTGEALFKAGPFPDEMNTWALLKKHLKEKIKKPVSFEYAQEDLSQIFQKKDESIEEYGNRLKQKLKKLNEASKTLTETAAEQKILQKTNEKQAISKFEQNLRDRTIKVLVSAASKSTLDECITFAMQKELIEKNKNVKSCAICGLNNHEESQCRRRKNGDDSKPKFGSKKYNDYKNGGQRNNGSNKNSQNYKGNNPYTPKNNEKPSTSGNSQPSGSSYKNYNRPKNGGEKSNDFYQKNVKTVAEEETDDTKTVREALNEKNSKN